MKYQTTSIAIPSTSAIFHASSYNEPGMKPPVLISTKSETPKRKSIIPALSENVRPLW